MRPADIEVIGLGCAVELFKHPGFNKVIRLHNADVLTASHFQALIHGVTIPGILFIKHTDTAVARGKLLNDVKRIVS